MADILLTTGQVAEKFSVHPATVIRWANEGKLPCIWTPGRHRRFRTSDCDRFLENTSGEVANTATTATAATA